MHRYVALSIMVVLAWSMLGGNALAHSSRRGMGYERALAVKKAQPVKHGPSKAEKRAVARWGRDVGRWWSLCDRYWPASQLNNCMYCIKHESGGNPKARNGIYKGLFQLGGYKCNVWPPETNIRLAHKLWTHRGWQPWTTMR